MIFSRKRLEKPKKYVHLHRYQSPIPQYVGSKRKMHLDKKTKQHSNFFYYGLCNW